LFSESYQPKTKSSDIQLRSDQRKAVHRTGKSQEAISNLAPNSQTHMLLLCHILSSQLEFSAGTSTYERRLGHLAAIHKNEYREAPLRATRLNQIKDPLSNLPTAGSD